MQQNVPPVGLLPGVLVAESVHLTAGPAGVLLTFQVQHPGTLELVPVAQVKMAPATAGGLRSALNQAWAALATIEETPGATENVVPLHRG